MGCVLQCSNPKKFRVGDKGEQEAYEGLQGILECGMYLDDTPMGSQRSLEASLWRDIDILENQLGSIFRDPERRHPSSARGRLESSMLKR